MSTTSQREAAQRLGARLPVPFRERLGEVAVLFAAGTLTQCGSVILMLHPKTMEYGFNGVLAHNSAWNDAIRRMYERWRGDIR